MTVTDEQVAVLTLTEAAAGPWYDVSDLVEQTGSAVAVAEGRGTFLEARDRDLARELASRVKVDMFDRWRQVLELALFDDQTQLVTVLDEGYPANLRRIYNRPPFLFVRGALTKTDDRSVAIVGTRAATEPGIAEAGRLATALAQRGVTVMSGLAAGIDTAAHTAALAAGGRTVAVMGTGIDKVYPAENRGLAARIPEDGALVSQFWPGSPPRRQNFPLRNVVTSGIAVGTVVIEASATSGAKMQARLALEHGKSLFLLEELVMHEEWARRYARRRGALVVRSVDDVLDVLDAQREDVVELQLF